MPTLFKNGKNYSGTSVSLTQAEYDALTETQKNDGTVYFITDSDAVLDASDVALGSGTVETLAGSIATIETSPATANHSVGEYIVYNGQLYKVTTAITAGTTLTGKISAVSVGEQLSEALAVGYTEATTLSGMTASLNQLNRVGNLCVLSLNVNVTTAISGWSSGRIVIPSEFRPSRSQNMFIAYKAGSTVAVEQWQVLSDGNVRCGANIPTGTLNVTLTYFMA